MDLMCISNTFILQLHVSIIHISVVFTNQTKEQELSTMNVMES